MTRFADRAEFDRLVLGFKHTAFRLEARDAYNEPSEQSAVQQFLDTGKVDETLLAGWVQDLGRRTAEGQRMERVRVVTVPHSDYTRFGLALAHWNTLAGEDIRYLPRHHAGDLPDSDWWLIDSTMLLMMRFGDGDRLLGADVVTDPATVVQYGYYRDLAQHYATPWAEYVRSSVVDELPASP